MLLADNHFSNVLIFTGEPCFNCSVEFKRTYKVHQTEIPSHDNSPISKLNLTQLSRMTGLDRSLSDKIYNKFVTTIGGGIRLNKNILLTVHKVAEIFINNESVKVMFLPDFLSAIGSKSQKVKGSGLKRPSSAPRASRRSGDVLDVSTMKSPTARARPSTPSGRARPVSDHPQQQRPGVRNKKPIPRGKKKVDSVMTRNHNPILGDDSDIVNVHGKKRSENDAFNVRRNPILNAEEESLVSEEQSYQDSVSAYSTSSRGSRGSKTSSMMSPRYGAKQRSQRPSALVKENLMRHNARQGGKKSGEVHAIQ